MGSRHINLWGSVDWFSISIYVLLVTFGWISICGASYDFGEIDFFSFDSRSGKQLMWIGFSFVILFVILMLDADLYQFFSYTLYVAMMLLLVVTILIAPNIKGSHSWLVLGPVSLQPAEFAKFATGLALANFMSSHFFSIKSAKYFFIALCMILLPMGLILLQNETGSALVFLAFFLVLYREGMPGSVLFAGVSAILYFIVSIKYGPEVYGVTPLGEYLTLIINLLFTGCLLMVYTNQQKKGLGLIVGTLLLVLALYLVIEKLFVFNLLYVIWTLVGLVICYLLFLSINQQSRSFLWIALFSIGSFFYAYSSDYVFDNVLESHQQKRIKLVLNMEEDLAKAGYNVHQSKIAIGSGGLTGKGFLNGTQTKLKYVPEQDTDFIFCTVGEEQGFVGASVVLILFLLLILRLIFLAEQQKTTFGRVYGYSLISILIFHLFINVGMVLGLTPVIGIPLPFFSYGGSSLWGFTILLFVFLRIDADRYTKF